MQPVPIDRWILQLHQWIANWVFSYWNHISPYWIGAQMFLAIMGMHVGYSIYRMHGVGSYGWYTTLLLVNLFWQAGGYFWGADQHERWEKGELLKSPPPGLFAWRIFFSIFGVISLAALIASAGNVSNDRFGFIWLTLLDFAVASASYFLSCDAPTNLRREQRELLPQAT